MGETILFGLATLAVLYLVWWLWRNDDGAAPKRKRFGAEEDQSNKTEV